MRIKYIVSCGKIEFNDDGSYYENCKYVDSFESMEDAHIEHQANNSYPWSRIDVEIDGEIAYTIGTPH